MPSGLFNQNDLCKLNKSKLTNYKGEYAYISVRE